MAFIADAIVSKVLEDLTTLAIEEIKQEVRLVVGVEDEVNKLTENLQAIQDVLFDAEKKQLKEASIKRWLKDLKEISYEMDDVLDEWRSAMLIRSQVDAGNHPTASSSHVKRKVCAFIASCCFRPGEFGLRHRHDIARKIKNLNKRLDDIAVRKNNYGLVSDLGVGVQQVNRNTISDINVREVKGRGEEVEKITDMLTANSSRLVPHIISFVGMGGLGKTTLAQLAYNSAKVEEHFDKTIWVCVSDPFDENKVAKAILESLDKSSETELQSIVQNIKAKISGKKILLVLDDVWNEDPNKWKNVKAALMCGLPGSTILVTTRKDTVAKVMGCAELDIFRPGHLSKKECWSIICDEVMLSGMIEEELELLQDIGHQIADKCRGLPLAAKALGGLLRFKIGREEWQSVLDSEMWELGKEEAEIERNLFAPLWLSYYDLSSAERQCLSYCAIFLKDVELGKKFLIKLWMAQGYLVETKTKDMEMIGEEYFRNLCARSFFQDFKKGSNGKIKACKMHDIVHDFVQLISKKECLCMELEGNRFDSIRHLYYRFLHISPTVYTFKKLRSLVLDSCGELDLCYLFNELTCLRSLALTNCDISEIPSTIGRLIHLRLLDLHRNSELRELPENVCDLCNLLILDLRDCSNLERLPCGIEKLSKLRYLYTDNYMIKLRYLRTENCMIKLTQGVARSLNAIRKASFLVDSEATSMGNLKNLKHLKSVCIQLRRNVEDVVGVRQAQLSEKKHLVSLELSIDLLESETEEEELHDEELITR